LAPVVICFLVFLDALAFQLLNRRGPRGKSPVALGALAALLRARLSGLLEADSIQLGKPRTFFHGLIFL
jgi:hypothetical protein